MATTKEQLIQEIEQASDEVLERFLQVWQQTKQSNSSLTQIKNEVSNPRTPGLLKGTLGDQFFEPLPEAEIAQWETNI